MSAATSPTTGAPAAGWYPDPRGGDDLRWWDGDAWTAHTVPTPEPVPAEDADVLGSRDAEPIAFSWSDPIDEIEVIVTDERDPRTAESPALLSAFDWFVKPIRSAPEPPDSSPTEPQIVADVAAEPEPEVETEPEPIPPHVLDALVREALFPRTLLLTAGAPEPEPEREPVEAEAPAVCGAFVFRTRSLQRRREVLDADVPALYESPLSMIASPVERVAMPEPVAEAPAVEAPVVEAPPQPVRSWRPRPPRRLTAGTGMIAAFAATAALATNLIASHDAPRARAAAAPAMSAAARSCMKQWNTTAGGGAAQLRVTLGQFEGALAKVGPVKPLPNTVMSADSCALTVYDPSSDTHATFLAGIKDTIGYQDATSYPRASTYGWPKTARDANVTIRPDGTIRAF